MIVQRVKTQSLCFKLYLLKNGREEYVEGQLRVDHYSACRWWKNAIYSRITGQEGQEKILPEERKERGY